MCTVFTAHEAACSHGDAQAPDRGPGWRRGPTPSTGPRASSCARRRGDHFRTNVAVPLFAEAVRALAVLMDDALGRPDPFDLVDVGAGRGELLHALTDVPPRWRLTGVDLAEADVPFTWTREIPEVTGLLLANEWLDSIPVPIIQDGHLVLVDDRGTETEGPAHESAWAETWWPGRGRVEIGEPRDLAWQHAVSRVRRGAAVAVDYGHQLAGRRPTLTGYRDGRQVPPVPDGTCDLTAHVALDSCAATTGAVLLSQEQALRGLGISGRLPDAEDPSYALELVRASQGRELLDPAGLGGFGWLVQSVGRRRWLDALVKQVVAGVGPAALSRSDITLELGAHHPSTHGSLRLRLELDGDVVVTAEPLVGALHRGAEKLFEVRDYRQVLVLANRHDWLAAFNNEVGVALAVEELLGLEVPARATWLRTLLAEVNRVLSHLMFLGYVEPSLLAAARGPAARPGGGDRRADPRRLHPGRRAARGRPASGGPTAAAQRGAAGARGASRPWTWRASRGWACSLVDDALSYGVSGPVGRASGLDLDLRRDAPVLAYASLEVPVVTRRQGDAAARFACLLEQVRGLARPGRRLPRPAARRAGQRAAAEDGAGTRGRDLLLDRGAVRDRRLLPGLARGADAVAAGDAHRVVQQRVSAAGGAARHAGAGPAGRARVVLLRRRRHRPLTASSR